jgi:high-affinity Fe2+/Pb2+ permease
MKGVFKRIGDQLRLWIRGVELFGLIVSSIVGLLVYSGKIPIIQGSRAESSLLTAFIIFAALLLFRLGLRAIKSTTKSRLDLSKVPVPSGRCEKIDLLEFSLFYF